MSLNHLVEGRIDPALDLNVGKLFVNNNIIYGNTTTINTLDDFPEAINGVISLADDTAYIISGYIDLLGSRLVCGTNTAILGTTSETSFLTSSGLNGAFPLIYSNHTLPIQNITFINVQRGIEIDGTGIMIPVAIDWLCVNFTNVPTIGTVKNATNFIFSSGSFLNSQNLSFDGTIGTVGFNNSLFVGNGSPGNIFNILDTCIITRRFRIIYSSLVCFGSTVGLNFSVLATVPVEGYILDTINFSGGGTYLTGVDDNSNSTLFTHCVGITNTSVYGQLYMRNNPTQTPIANTNDFFKVLGTTTPSPDNEKYIATNNRLTNDAVVERRYFMIATLSFNSGTNNIVEFAFYDSTLGDIRLPSITASTANASGRAESVTITCSSKQKQGDYIEIFVRNTSSTTAVTVTDMNFVMYEVA